MACSLMSGTVLGMAAPQHWRATYRLQLNPQFSLDDAAGIVPYLKTLGVSHLYLSPCLTATPGSEHGYDVADPTTISEQLGGRAAFSRLASSAREAGLGILLDIVPNHMTTHVSNRFFRDVLAHGRMSPHVSKLDFYDVVSRGEPVTIGTLGRPYGETLKKGEIQIAIEDHQLVVQYYEHVFPTNPASWTLILGEGVETLASQWCKQLAALQDAPTAELHGAVQAYQETLSQLRPWLESRLEEKRAEVEARLKELNSDHEQLDGVLRRQNFRLMWWKLEGEFINYRRFFNIGSLIGVRMEDPEVFSWAHTRVADLVRAGEVQGLRVDHPDGLRDPKRYFDQLRELLPSGHVYVEKILDGDETLPPDWAIDGSVGYDFLSRVNCLWMDESREREMTSIYADFTGHPINYLRLVREQKREVLQKHFLGDLERLTALGAQVVAERYETRDVSYRDLQRAIAETIVALPVYRTYLNEQSKTAHDQELITSAVALARSLVRPETESLTLSFDLLERILLSSAATPARREFLARFQQLSPAVMAKGAEDTTFYRYDRLVSCNEVGAQPSAFGIAAEHFHQYMSHLHHSWPNNLLTTSTHDTKRSGDVRARISLLSEIPDKWHAQLLAWADQNAGAWMGRQPDRHVEYLLYQTLVGAHPLSPERAFAYIQKAVREAKLYTSWHEPNAIYEEKLREFIFAIGQDESFQKSLDAFCDPLWRPGRINALAQILIKLTAPGVPDFYQGTELWDLSLVDPDNRRPVDFEERARLLEQARNLSASELDEHWDSGLVKMWMIDRALSLRSRHPEALQADYRPLIARGKRLRHVLAYGRGADVVVVLPRFGMSIDEDFSDTELELPEGRFRCAFSEQSFEGLVSVEQLFSRFPVTLLVREELC